MIIENTCFKTIFNCNSCKKIKWHYTTVSIFVMRNDWQRFWTPFHFVTELAEIFGVEFHVTY